MPLEAIRVSDSDTGMTPPDFGSTGSRSTYCGGIVAKRACEDVKKKLYQLAHEKYGVPEDDLEFKGGCVGPYFQSGREIYAVPASDG